MKLIVLKSKEAQFLQQIIAIFNTTQVAEHPILGILVKQLEKLLVVIDENDAYKAGTRKILDFISANWSNHDG